MIPLGLRLAVSGGREAIIRLVIVAAAVGIGVGLLLTVVAAVNAVGVQNDRYAWLDTEALAASGGARTATSREPLWLLFTTDLFDGQTIYRADVAATGPASPVPPGIPRDPGPGQYYISPALAALARSAPADELADRYPGHQAGLIGQAGLPSPSSLVIVVGRSAAQMSHLPGAAKVTSLNTTPPSGCGNACQMRGGGGPTGIDLILSVVGLALLLPVLIFIGTATRLSAARREQRFAAMRLVGATPRQVSVIAAVESAAAAAAGAAIGFGLFFVLRIPLAAIAFTGQSFFPAELSLSLPDILAVAVGVPGSLRRRGPAGAAPGEHLSAGRHPPGDPGAAAGLAGAAAAGRPGRPRVLHRTRQAGQPCRADPGVRARRGADHDRPGHRGAVADNGGGAGDGPARQPPRHADRRAAPGR